MKLYKGTQHKLDLPQRKCIDSHRVGLRHFQQVFFCCLCCLSLLCDASLISLFFGSVCYSKSGSSSADWELAGPTCCRENGRPQQTGVFITPWGSASHRLKLPVIHSRQPQCPLEQHRLAHTHTHARACARFHLIPAVRGQWPLCPLRP